MNLRYFFPGVPWIKHHGHVPASGLRFRREWYNPDRLHRYHPDHGTNRAYAVTREIHLLLGVAANVPPGEGDEALGGSYSETVTGLHKQPLISSGSLFLRRISDVGTLNVP